MTWRTSLLAVGLWSAVLSLAFAQAPPAPPPSADQEQIDVSKLRWVCGQLQLDQKQLQQAKALMDVYQAELEEVAQDHGVTVLLKIQELLAQIDVETANGNQQRVAELRQEIAKLAPETAAEDHFFHALEQVLTDEQKGKLPKLRQQAPAPVTPPTPVSAAVKMSDPSGQVVLEPGRPAPASRPAEPKPAVVRAPAETQPARVMAPATQPATPTAELRPFHVLNAARQYVQTPDSHRRFEAVMEEFRFSQRMGGRDPGAAPANLDRLIQNVSAILPEKEAAEYLKKIEALRAAPPPAQPIAPPAATRPAGPPTPLVPATRTPPAPAAAPAPPPAPAPPKQP